MLNVMEQAPADVVRSVRAPTVSEAKMHSLFQRKAVSDTIVKSVKSKTRFIVPIAETVGKMVNSTLDRYRLHNIKEASRTVANVEPSIECSPHHELRPLKIPSDSEWP